MRLPQVITDTNRATSSEAHKGIERSHSERNEEQEIHALMPRPMKKPKHLQPTEHATQYDSSSPSRSLQTPPSLLPPESEERVEYQLASTQGELREEPFKYSTNHLVDKFLQNVSPESDALRVDVADASSREHHQQQGAGDPSRAPTSVPWPEDASSSDLNSTNRSQLTQENLILLEREHTASPSVCTESDMAPHDTTELKSHGVDVRQRVHNTVPEPLRPFATWILHKVHEEYDERAENLALQIVAQAVESLEVNEATFRDNIQNLLVPRGLMETDPHLRDPGFDGICKLNEVYLSPLWQADPQRQSPGKADVMITYVSNEKFKTQGRSQDAPFTEEQEDTIYHHHPCRLEGTTSDSHPGLPICNLEFEAHSGSLSEAMCECAKNGSCMVNHFMSVVDYALKSSKGNSTIGDLKIPMQYTQALTTSKNPGPKLELPQELNLIYANAKTTGYWAYLHTVGFQITVSPWTAQLYMVYMVAAKKVQTPISRYEMAAIGPLINMQDCAHVKRLKHNLFNICKWALGYRLQFLQSCLDLAQEHEDVLRKARQGSARGTKPTLQRGLVIVSATSTGSKAAPPDWSTYARMEAIAKASNKPPVRAFGHTLVHCTTPNGSGVAYNDASHSNWITFTQIPCRLGMAQNPTVRCFL
ncbi:hypothetical protein NA57DRAFT_62164 [Rhizodiscina lignyota]|uniref:Uncharacterized protein n=1 Tax=Rhizodiscina lignyota TaxID=1504668 RepID=A0A9P4I0S0_9PEZI|nr:hypothetical protein NA57DRAFT_62164 [Rhizodiscina lignyota]